MTGFIHDYIEESNYTFNFANALGDDTILSAAIDDDGMTLEDVDFTSTNVIVKLSATNLINNTKQRIRCVIGTGDSQIFAKSMTLLIRPK